MRAKINEIDNRKWMSMKQKAGSLKRSNKSINPLLDSDKKEKGHKLVISEMKKRTSL